MEIIQRQGPPSRRLSDASPRRSQRNVAVHVRRGAPFHYGTAATRGERNGTKQKEEKK